jgi:hypothetical protein
MKKSFFLILVALFLQFTKTNAQDDKFKALFIYNFTKMIEWPANKKAGDFVIAVMGNPTIASELAGLNKKVVNQPIVVKEISDAGSIGDCHILFIGSADTGKLGAAISAIGDKPTLIITDSPGGCKKGSGINFIKSDSGIDYEYNLGNINPHNLSVSLDFKSLGKGVN